MMKGQTKELMDFVIVIVGVSIMLIMSYFIFGTKTIKISSITTEEHMYGNVIDSSIDVFYMKIPEIDKVFAQMLGDMVMIKGNYTGVVDYGDAYGGINVTKIVYSYFDSYFGEKRWRLIVPRIRNADIAMVIDSSESMPDDATAINEQIPLIMNAARNRGYNLEIKIYLLPVHELTCDYFEESINSYNVECEQVTAAECGLVHTASEDWGHGAKCVAEKEEEQVIIVVGDELSTSSNGGGSPCYHARTGKVDTKSTKSVEDGIAELKKREIPGFAIAASFFAVPKKETYKCFDGTATGELANYCFCALELDKQFAKFAEETGGKYYNTVLEGYEDVGEIVQEIVEKDIIPGGENIIFGTEPPTNARVRTFMIKIPVPSTYGEFIDIKFEQW